MNPQPRTGWLSVALNFFGVVVVTWALLANFSGRLSPTLFVLSGVGLLAWVVAIVLPLRNVGAKASSEVAGDPKPAVAPGAVPPPQSGQARALLAAFTVMVLCGALVAPPTLGLFVALVVAAVIRCISYADWPLWWGMTLVLAAMAIVALVALAEQTAQTAQPVLPALSAPAGGGTLSPIGFLAIEGGIVVAALAGYSRRQYRTAELQTQVLREQRDEAREKQAALATLAERQVIARDIHDVLAHSLGGLVIQLDAVDALLESGDVSAAETRVRQARQLAASGLSDARRAVDALREPETTSPVSGSDLLLALAELVEANRALGAHIDYTVAIAPDLNLSGEAATALRRALQEMLTNARKHAAAQPVQVTLDSPSSAVVRLRVSNPLGAPLGLLASSGNRRGLLGMAERFARLPGATVTAGPVGGSFVVEAVVEAMVSA